MSIVTHSSTLISATVGQKVIFLAETTGTLPITYTWDLGDGTSELGRVFPATYGQGAAVSHTYAATGTYFVVLVVENRCGEDTDPVSVTIVPAPHAWFENNSPVSLDEPVVFTNTSVGLQPLHFLWDFGDGNTSTETHPIHSYDTEDTYFVTLVVTNTYGEDFFGDSVEILAGVIIVVTRVPVSTQTPVSPATPTEQPVEPTLVSPEPTSAPVPTPMTTPGTSGDMSKWLPWALGGVLAVVILGGGWIVMSRVLSGGKGVRPVRVIPLVSGGEGRVAAQETASSASAGPAGEEGELEEAEDEVDLFDMGGGDDFADL